MSDQEFYKFAAFISYSSKDRDFAKRLHKDLENYRVPLKREDLGPLDSSNRLRPIFLDFEELSSGALSGRLQSALQASASLIVVCSPDAATSPWVEKEIEYFRKLDCSDKIFAIIKSGIPNAPASRAGEECLPAALRDPMSPEDTRIGILAGDARRRFGYRSAWLKIVAGILEVNLGSLVVRDRSRYLAASLLFGVILAILVAGAMFTVAMMKGYATQMASAITAVQGDVVGLGFDRLDATESANVLASIVRNEKVQHVSSIIEQKVLVSAKGRAGSVLAQGIAMASRDPTPSCKMCAVARRLLEVPAGAVIGAAFARQFGLAPGDDVFLTHNVDNQPATRRFTVADVESYNLVEFEAGVVQLNLETTRSFWGRNNGIDAVAIWLLDPEEAPEMIAALDAATKGKVHFVGFEDRNRSFFSVLSFERRVVQALLVIPLFLTVFVFAHQLGPVAATIATTAGVAAGLGTIRFYADIVEWYGAASMFDPTVYLLRRFQPEFAIEPVVVTLMAGILAIASAEAMKIRVRAW